MILDKPEHTLQRAGLAGEKQFKIALSAKIYSMMSDKLYADRTGSVVREVCSNAWDGMKMKSLATGQPIEPFRVTLPTELEPHFIVEDFGVGMPDEQAQELYSTLGLSTKEDTNDQIGAFGLGSKSPFAVTDTFTVENTYDGVTYYYLCFKSEDGLPSILPTGKKEEARPNGVKVIIPASGLSYLKYQHALQRQLIAMEPKPIITNGRNFEFVKPEIVSENEFGYYLANATAFGLSGRSLYVRMGMVLYPVDTSQTGFSYDSKNIFQNSGSTTCLILNVPIGAVEPLPSREALTYDTRTIKNIQNQLEEFKKVYRKVLIEQVSNKPTPLEAYNEIIRIKNATGLNLFQDNIYVNGWPIKEINHPNIFPRFEREYLYTPPPILDKDGKLTEDQPQSEIKKVMESQFIYEQFDASDTRLNIKRTPVELYSLKFSFLNYITSGTYKFLLMDEEEPKHRVSRMKSILNALPRSEYLLVVRVNHLYPGDKTDFSAFLAGLESIHPGISANCITRFSSVPKPDFARGDRKAKDADAILDGVVRVMNTFEVDVRPSMLDKISEEKNFDGNAFYLKLHRNEIIDYKDQNLKKFKEFAHEAGFYLFLVRATGVNKISALEDIGIVEFSTCIENHMKDYTPSDVFRKRQSCVELHSDRHEWFSYPASRHVSDLIEGLKSEGEDIPRFFKIWEEVKEIKNSEIKMDRQNTITTQMKNHDVFDIFKDRDWAKLVAIDIKTDFEEAEKSLNEKYPLLHYLVLQDKGYRSGVNNHTARHKYVVDYNKLYRKTQTVTVTPY